MAGILHKTRGIVLRTVPYGDTSLIASIYTEKSGLRSYILKGIRSGSKKGNPKSNYFQPAALLDLVVYHNEFKQLNQIKDFGWAQVYRHIFTDVLRNGVVQYMIELLGKCLKQPEADTELFAFMEDSLLTVDLCSDRVMANFPVFFSIHLAHFFGLMPASLEPGIPEMETRVFDLQEGVFCRDAPAHQAYLEAEYCNLMAEMMRVRQPAELEGITANSRARGQILEAMQTYYSIHIQEFGKMKTLPILHQILR